jgi:hypothetical protein
MTVNKIGPAIAIVVSVFIVIGMLVNGVNALKGTDTREASTPTVVVPVATPTPENTKANAEYMDPRQIAADAKGQTGKNVWLQGRALNVDQKGDYTWVQLEAEEAGRPTTEYIVVEVRPKDSSILKEECYRFYGVVGGTQKVTRTFTGATNDAPFVKAYATESAPRASSIGCAPL